MAVSDHPQGYQCEFIDTVPDDFYCKKCTLVAKRLTFTSCCGESYCHACIVDTQQQTKPCPECGEKTFTTIKPLKYQRRLEGLQVYCSMRGRGCGWSGTLDQLDTHIDPDQDNYQYVDTKCPLNCQQTVPKNKVEQHVAKECVKRDYICQYCAFKATYEEVVDTHLPECIYVPLQCPNRCGVTCEREVMEDHMRMCRLEEVACEFSGVGCDGKFIREDQEEHTRQNNQKHISMIAAAAVKTNEQLQQKLQEQEQKFVEQEQKFVEKFVEQEQKFVEQEQKFVEQEQKFVKRMHELENKHQVVEQRLEQKIKEMHQMIGLNRMFAMENFSKEKAKDRPLHWKSPAMYTHVCGYKFCIGIDANGYSGAHGKAITVSLRVMPGEYDHQLKWLAQASFTIELLNQQGGENIKCTTARKTWKKPTEPNPSIVAWFSCNAMGVAYAFLEHTKLGNFLHNDSLIFHVTDVTVV